MREANSQDRVTGVVKAAAPAGSSYGSSRKGSRRKVSDDRRYPGMGVGRESKGRFELRLGAVQATLWVGLAVGAMVGAYFVGFFSGRYVGFDTARSASAVEAPRLTIQDELLDRGSDRVGDVYSKLDGSSADEVSREREEKAPAQQSATEKTQAATGKTQVETSQAAKVAMEMRQSEAERDNSTAAQKEAAVLLGTKSGAGVKPSEGAVTAAEIDSLFDDAGAKDEKKGASSDQTKSAASGSQGAVQPIELLGEKEVAAPQKGVRVLGSNQPSASESAESDTSLGAILEERVAKARETQAKDAQGKSEGNKGGAGSVKADLPKAPPSTGVNARASSNPGAAAVPTSVSIVKNEAAAPSTASTGMVKQVLPAGYFAQVAAPKKMAEAQDVARRLKRSGFPVVIETAHVRGEDYFRVLVGPEDNKTQADRLVEQLKRESYLSGSAFLRRVK